MRHSNVYTALCLLCASSHLFSARTDAAAPPTAQICNQAVYPVYTTYVYVHPASTRWEAIGWWQVQPGDCLALEKSSNDIYYYFSHADSSDPVAQHLNVGDVHWGGQEGSNDSAIFCVPEKRFHRFAEECGTADRRQWFKRIVPTAAGISTYTLLPGPEAKELDLEIDSLDDAARAYRGLKGQLLYGESIGDDPTGTPFRIGVQIEADSHGVYITDVSPGMPADGLLLPGDRIAMIDGQLVHTVFDAIFLIQSFGYGANPAQRHLQVGVYRWQSADGQPEPLLATVDLAYYRNLDTEVNADSLLTAIGTGLSEGVLMGLGPYATCAAEGILDRLTEKPKHQRRAGCVAQEKRERARTYEMYPDETQIFDMIGSATTPRFAFRLLARQGAKRSVQRLAVASLDEAVQGAISEVAWADRLADVEAPALLRSMAIGAAIGGAAHLVTGQ